MSFLKKIFFSGCFIFSKNFSNADVLQSSRLIIINAHETHGINTQGFFSKLKSTIAYSGATVLVGYLIKKYIEFYSDDKKLISKNSWAHWKSQTNFKNLNPEETNNLKEELKKEIDTKYKNNFEFLSNHEAFIHDLQEEIQSLENYINLARKLKKFNLSSLTSITEKKLKLAKIKLNRLYFLKKLVLIS